MGPVSIGVEVQRNTNGDTPSSTNRVRTKGNSWLFLTVREIFSLQLGISHLPLLGHYLQNNCLSLFCSILVFGVSISAADSTTKTVSKN